MIGSRRPSPQRFRRATASRVVLGVVLGVVLAGCRHGHRGTPVLGPTIVAASFVGAGAAPQPGDTLLLTFSRDLTPVVGRLLTDADVSLSDGASLGAVVAAPAHVAPRTLAVELGPGVAFAPGAATITLSAANDVVRDIAGRFGVAATPVAIGASDGQPPQLSNVTVANVTPELNGTGPAGGTLQVATTGFRLDLAFADNAVVERAAITADVPVTGPAGSLMAGTDLGPYLTSTDATATGVSYVVPGDVVFPDATVTLDCTVVDASGLASAPRTFRVQTKTFTARLRPFETDFNPSQVWHVDFARDIETLTPTPTGDTARVVASAGANGIADFVEVLLAMGLNHDQPLTEVTPGKNSNDVVQDLFKQRLLADLAAFYAGAPVAFTLTPPGGSFGGAPTLPYSSFGFSRIAIAGSATVEGVLGVAIYDPRNETQEDDTLTDYRSQRLGIFLQTIADAGLSSPSTSEFRTTFDPLTPVFGGLAIGRDPLDGDRLLGTEPGERHDAIHQAIADFARFTAVVVAHECAHSMGLVENGPMPLGLYGNDPTHFPGSLDGHIRNANAFPPGSTNLMSPALSYSSTLHPATAFNSLNLAYLREQVFYGN